MECFDQYCNVENVARTIEQNIMEAIETFKKTSTQFFNEVSSAAELWSPLTPLVIGYSFRLRTSVVFCHQITEKKEVLLKKVIGWLTLYCNIIPTI